MKVAFLTTDNRWVFRDYDAPAPYFGPAPDAVLRAFKQTPDLEVHVVSCTRKPVVAPEKLADNIYFHSLYVPKFGWMRTGFQGCIRAMRKKLQQLQPDIVHGQGTEADNGLGAVFSGFPNVVTIHGNMRELARVFRSAPGSYLWLAGWLEKFTLGRTGGVFCNSEHTERLVRPVARRTWRVPNALREEFFAPRPMAEPSGKCKLLNIGVIGTGKRQLELLELALELRRQGLSFELQFVGQAAAGSPYAVSFLERIKSLEGEQFVSYLGMKSGSELMALMDAASALVHFPPEESFGLVVAEALARELKVFAARVGGIPDITSGAPGAELFGVEDWPGLTAGIANWIRQGCPRQKGGAELMRARYHPTTIAQRHIEIYREVLGERLRAEG
jgi:glycosyltransferase involved in cell wall biosynthesis